MLFDPPSGGFTCWLEANILVSNSMPLERPLPYEHPHKLWRNAEGHPSKSNLNSKTGMMKNAGGNTSLHRIVKVMASSTFCAEPPGDTLSRKGLIDAIVLGCIPILFEPQQLVMYEAFASRAEMEAMCVYIPELAYIGTNATQTHSVRHPHTHARSLYADANVGTLDDGGNVAWMGKKNMPPSEIEAIWGAMGEKAAPWQGLEWPVDAYSLDQMLLKIPQSVIAAKQQALARVAPRFVIQTTDVGEDDAVRRMLDLTLADATTTEEDKVQCSLED
jgi:hypothetical protein